MHLVARIPLGFVVVLQAACDEGRKPRPPRPEVAQRDVVTMLAEPIDTTVTLGAWLTAHPDDRVSDSIPAAAFDDEICRATRKKVVFAGRMGFLWALFQIPAPPADEMLPVDTIRLAERVCRLRVLWLEIEEPDTARARSIATALSGLLEKRLGAGENKLAITAKGAAGWLEPRTWKGPGTTVVLGIIPPAYEQSDEGPDTTRLINRRTISVVAYTPLSGFDDLSSKDWDRSVAHLTEEEAWEKAWLSQRIDSAIARVGIKEIERDLLTVMRRVRAVGMLDSAAEGHAELVRVAQFIRDSVPLLPPSRAGTVLFAGNLVLTHAAGVFDPADTTSSRYSLLKNLKAAGVEYGPEAYMIGYPYTHRWLWDAYRVDSLGPGGHAALVQLLASGWKTTAGCEDNVDQMALVIEHGEAAIRRGDKDPMIPFYVGLAYQDRFSLARGDYYEGYADPKRYEPLAEQGRVRGIQHFQAALGTLEPRHLRRDAWRTGIRLMLGKPSQPRYFCFDD